MAKKMTSNQKLTLASTTSGFALQNIDYSVVSFAMASMVASLGISSAAAGLIPSVANVGTLFGGIILGLLADRFGRVKIFSYTVLIFALATGLMYFANNIDFIYALRFVSGFVGGGEFGAGVALVAENFRHQKIGRLISLTQIGGQIGALITGLLAAVILPKFGWHALYLVGLIPAFFAFFIRRHLKESEQFIKRSQAKGYRKSVSVKQLFASPRRTWQTIGLCIMVTIQIAGYFGLMNWLPSIMQKNLGISVSSSTLWLVVTIIGMAIGMWAFGTMMDHFGPRLSYGIFLLASAASVYLIIVAFNTWTLLITCTVVGFFINGMYSGYGTIISRLYPTNVRATANNFIMNLGSAIGGFSPSVIGFLMDNSSLKVIVMLLSILYLISFVIMLLIPNLKRKQFTEFEKSND